MTSEDEHGSPSDGSERDYSFTSTATDGTFGSWSARSSVSERVYSDGHRRGDPVKVAIKAAGKLSPERKLRPEDVRVIRHLGSGELGRVYLCQLRGCESATFAMKVVDRDALTEKKTEQAEMEAYILSLLDHPFLPTLYSRFDASHFTCLLIDYCSGGDLHSVLRQQPAQRLPPHSVRFYAAEVLVALEYLHANGIIYRDLKPENILLRMDGHIMLSDFDLCFISNVTPSLRFLPSHSKSSLSSSSCFRLRQQRKDELMVEFSAEPTEAYSSSCVGTHEYLSPELLSGNGYGSGIDWWAFGILVYELLLGTTPFKGATKEATIRNIASCRQAKIPSDMSADAKDLIRRLLVKDPSRRLGYLTGATNIKRHRFFDGINWALLRNYHPPEINSQGLVVSKHGKPCFLQ